MNRQQRVADLRRFAERALVAYGLSGGWVVTTVWPEERAAQEGRRAKVVWRMRLSVKQNRRRLRDLGYCGPVAYDQWAKTPSGAKANVVGWARARTLGRREVIAGVGAF